MEHLLELNDIAGLVLREGVKANAPQPCRVSIYSYGHGPELELQLSSTGWREKVRAVALWADVLGTCVTLTEHDIHVDVSAATRVNGRAVRVWHHLTHRDAYELATLLDTDFGRGPIEATPAVIATAFEVFDDAEAMFAALDASTEQVVT